MAIKKELEQDYKNYVEMNSDPYSKAVVSAGGEVMKLLDEGKTPEEAEKGLHGHDLTGFMAGAAVSGVVKYHERGEEMKVWWNRTSVGTSDENGVKNPAIVTIEDSPPNQETI